MNARRIAFCLTFAPLIIAMGVFLSVTYPAFLFIAWMMRSESPWREAWGCIWDAPAGMIEEGWAATR